MFKIALLLFAATAAILVNASDFDSTELDIEDIEDFIIDGQNAARGQFPFYVYLKVDMSQGKASCGGSLISNQWVLTAAHCLNGASGAEVHLGSWKVNNVTEAGRSIHVVRKDGIFVHPKFSMVFIMNDIGLIKLPEPVEFTDVIQPVKLACSSKKNVDVIAVGNGLMHDSDKSLAPVLQYTPLKTVSILKCLPSFPFLLFRKSVICVKGEGHHSACRGDSGGPLITADNRALVGLTSFGSPFGCEHGFAEGFTRVASHLDWIKQVSGVQCQ